jgi:hypothetical protein
MSTALRDGEIRAVTGGETTGYRDDMQERNDRNSAVEGLRGYFPKLFMKLMMVWASLPYMVSPAMRQAKRGRSFCPQAYETMSFPASTDSLFCFLLLAGHKTERAVPSPHVLKTVRKGGAEGIAQVTPRKPQGRRKRIIGFPGFGHAILLF